ncbi:MAG: hypothetical protein IIX13_06050 [Bacteroidales bacterium]|nr:hypothetical protein [Bacteroidales bacterium]
MEDILSPLEQFQAYKEKFREIAEKTFEELTSASGVNPEENRALCVEIQDIQTNNKKTAKTLKLWTALCIFMWIVAAVCVIICIADGFKNGWLIPTLCIVGCVSMLVLLFWKIHPIIKKYKSIKNEQETLIKNKEQEAWDMMAPLNRLYDWDVFNRMMTQTVPRLEFDPYFTSQRLADLVNSYGWDENFSKERSVIYSHSGLINGNPFVIARTRKMEMGTKEYKGELTVKWKTVEIDSEGKRHERNHSETLRASVHKPYPEYYEKTRLIYGNDAAPDLNFTRDTNDDKLEVDSRAYKRKLKEIEKFSRDLKNDFAMATNEEFEVLFTTTNRNNNQQYFLLFTPLAQENMIKIIRDKELGYGDNFQFMKHRKMNTLTAGHMQDLPLDMNPRMFWSSNYDKAKQVFLETTCENFRAIYFAFAPLLSIPMYQQIRPVSAIYGTDMPRQSTYWEHESLANFWGEDKFADPSCATHCILKTSEERKDDGSVEVKVRAYGYRAEPRIDYVSKYCSNGNYYDVPVHWDEYIPVMGSGSMTLQEDTTDEQPNLTPIERLQAINEKIDAFGEDSIFRRHITSRLVK